jgi:hypothetical protein
MSSEKIELAACQHEDSGGEDAHPPMTRKNRPIPNPRSHVIIEDANSIGETDDLSTHDPEHGQMSWVRPARDGGVCGQ